ncbi:meprin A subunit beta-like protein [Labeo rohita]|uniref:Metalloendopeptidase n=1 Tax=Labeo rohita TaxID=84645 RepID=A0A498NXB9_LABRO|nr:meprin A subunit beta-like protein [Labeo rohita]
MFSFKANIFTHRDDYVTIVWDQIEAGKEHNFNSYDETESSNLGVPYDYSSVMHYSKTAFSKTSEPTIVTKIPEFLDVIGQRMEFSDSDLLKLNRLYNCTTTTTFLDSCHFEEPNICGMIQGDGGKAKWARVQTVEGGPQTDYTNLGQCQGGLQGSWELYHVTLDVSNKFRVVFEGVKGGGASTGGLSLDDINLSETQCPQYTWRIRDFTSLLATTPAGSKTYSPRFLSPDGYSFQIGLYINGVTDNPDNMAIYLHLTSGPNDDSLQWPCPWRQASMELMDQNPNIQHRMNNIRMVTTDPTKTSTDSMGNVEYFWDDPRKVGSLVTDSDGSSFYRGPGYGTSSYITHDRLKSRSFIKGDDVIFLLSLEGL